MNPIRQTACYLTAVLFLACLIQGELLMIREGLDSRMPAEQQDEGLFLEYQEALESVWEELEWFPIPESSANPLAEVAFENTWQADRSYGGTRTHEGTDIMASIEEAGYYPVVSITDGTVEQVGWLPKGGYRIGIRSPSGGYFYYAHLSSYARKFQEGEPVFAGETLGFMGDTGYGEEGTYGKFDVHLHLGIYIKTARREEVSVNPYWVLRYLQEGGEKEKG